MLSCRYLFESSQSFSLTPIDEKFFKTIKDYKEIYYNPNDYNFYYSLMVDNNKAGVVGIVVLGNNTFFQIAIHDKYRRMGLVKIGSDLIAEKHNLSKLYATIENDNIASINAHIKAGFVKLSDKIISNLIKDNKLKSDQIRLIKTYN